MRATVGLATTLLLGSMGLSGVHGTHLKTTAGAKTVGAKHALKINVPPNEAEVQAKKAEVQAHSGELWEVSYATIDVDPKTGCEVVESCEKFIAQSPHVVPFGEERAFISKVRKACPECIIPTDLRHVYTSIASTQIDPPLCHTEPFQPFHGLQGLAEPLEGLEGRGLGEGVTELGEATGEPGEGPGEPGEGPGEPGEPGEGPGEPGEPGEGPGEPGEPGEGPGEPGEATGEPEEGLGEPGEGLGEPSEPGEGSGKPEEGVSEAVEAKEGIEKGIWFELHQVSLGVLTMPLVGRVTDLLCPNNFSPDIYMDISTGASGSGSGPKCEKALTQEEIKEVFASVRYSASSKTLQFILDPSTAKHFAYQRFLFDLSPCPYVPSTLQRQIWTSYRILPRSMVPEELPTTLPNPVGDGDQKSGANASKASLRAPSGLQTSILTATALAGVYLYL